MLCIQRTSKLIFVLSLLAAGGCAHEARQKPTTDVSRATAQSGGREYVIIDFERGRSALSSLDRQKLSRLGRAPTDEGRKIDEIAVLAWADREYPQEGVKASRQEIALANDRADAIKNYLKDDLQAEAQVNKQNMAERPGFFSEMMRTDSYKTKTAFEDSGAAPTHAQLTGNKSSKAVIFVKFE